MVYLDWAATTPPYKKAVQAMADTMVSHFGNPSSAHNFGLESKEILDQSREKCAELLHCHSNQIIYTSGGTEANNMVIYSLLKAREKGEVILCGLEHPATTLPALNMAKMGAKIKKINPGKDGLVQPEKLKKVLNEKTRMVIIMLLNNEVGVIQPLEGLISAVRYAERDWGRTIHFHSDM